MSSEQDGGSDFEPEDNDYYDLVSELEDAWRLHMPKVK